MIAKDLRPIVLYKALITLTVLFCLTCEVYGQKRSLPQAADLKVEYLSNPLGLDTLRPRLSWIYSDTTRAARQTAYRIIVSSDRKEAEQGKGMVWDTGQIASSETVNINYEGKKLKSGERYYWRVRVWDQNNKPGAWSRIHSFHMGLLEPEDWKARWITTPDSSIASPLMRGRFTVSKEIESAYAYVTGMGYYELYLNGEKVGDHVLDPAMTDFRKRMLYETYEVIDFLNKGENTWGLWLGNGAFRVKGSEDRWAWPDTDNYFGTPMGLAQLHIRYRDGSTELFTSDSSWKTSASPVTYNNLFGGETYDARLEQPGWNEPGFNDSAWKQVRIAERPQAKMDSQLMPPIRVTQTISPVGKTEPEPGVYLFDMGQNFAGWWQVKTEGRRGTVLKIRGAETLNDSLFPAVLKDGDRLSTDKAYHRDVWTTYVLKGEATEIYEPRFFYTGFRYVEVTVDDPAGLKSLEIRGRVVHTDLKRNGRFTSSHSLLNQIYEAAVWSQRGNLHGYPTDCPHREKGGYNGDGQVIAETSIHDFHMQAFYEKWLNDMADAQQENGRIPNTSPTIIGGYGGGIAWGSAYILIPWWMYQYYEDRRLLERHYPGMKRYMSYLRELASGDDDPAEKYVIDEFGGHWDSLGEWEAPVGEKNGPVNPLTNTYYWYLDAITIAGIADILGKEEDRDRFMVLSDSIKTAFNRKFFDPETNLYGTEEPYQSYLLFALNGNLVPEGRREAVADNLINDIMINREGHLGTGILGTKHLFGVLAGLEREDVIHRIVTQRTFPGWGYWIENGATTLWENWRGENSHNHQMFGSVNEYFYKYLSGIRPPVEEGTTTGYKTIHIKPYIPEGMDYAGATLHTIRGEVRSYWQREEGRLHLSVTLPANTSGKISIPALGYEEVRITESGKTIWENGVMAARVPTITDGSRTGDYIEFKVSSGKYIFKLSELR